MKRHHLTANAVRRTRRTREPRRITYREYVTEPARRHRSWATVQYLGFLLSVTLVGLAYAMPIAYNGRAVLVFISVGLFAVGLAARAGIHEERILRAEWQQHQQPTVTEVVVEPEELPSARVIQSNRGPVTIREPDVVLDGVTIYGAEVLALRELDGTRLTRDGAGLSGSRYGVVRDALRAAGYVDDDNEWTEEGLAWLA